MRFFARGLVLVAMTLAFASTRVEAQRVDAAFPGAPAAAAVDVTWVTPPPCLHTDQLEAEIARLAGATGAPAERPRFTARFMEIEAGGYRLQLQARGRTGTSERTVNTTSCRRLSELTVLLIAAGLGSDGAAPREESVSTPESLPEQAGAWTRRSWSLSLGGIGDWKALPGVSGGPLAGVVLQLEPARLWFEARYLAPRTAQTGFTGVESALQMVAAAVGGARVWRIGSFALGPCAELEMGYLHGRLSGTESARSAGSLWLTALGGGLFEQALDARVALQLRALVGAPLYRQPFALVGEPPFYTTAGYTIRLGLGVRVAIGPKTATSPAIHQSVSLLTR